MIRGAEAIIERTERGVKKTRIQKGYRHPTLDAALRKSRTKREAKVLARLHGLVPELLKQETCILELSYIDAPLVKQALTQENATALGTAIGDAVKNMHDAGVVHGDLTTSNVFATSPVTIIDFGLAEFSKKLEDRAVDLHMLKQSLKTAHPHIRVWDAVLDGYKPSQALLERLEEVQSRGRNKGK